MANLFLSIAETITKYLTITHPTGKRSNNKNK